MGVTKSNWKSYETAGEKHNVRATLSLGAHWSFDFEILPNKDTSNNEIKIYSSL